MRIQLGKINKYYLLKLDSVITNPNAMEFLNIANIKADAIQTTSYSSRQLIYAGIGEVFGDILCSIKINKVDHNTP